MLHRLALVLTALSLGSCDGFLDNLPEGLGQNAVPPTVQVGALELRHGPSLSQLAAYYCPTVMTDPLVALGCTAALGAPPPRSSLTFEFGINLDLHNPNDIPIPTLDVLLALTLFQGAQAEALAGVCVSLCGSDDPSCDGRPRPGACEARQDDILTAQDLVRAIPGLISDVVTGRAAEELKKSTILAGGDVHLQLAFFLGVDQALRVFERVASNVVSDSLAGRTPTLTVPVSAAGTVFFQIPVLGRVGVGYGPFGSSWRIL